MESDREVKVELLPCIIFYWALFKIMGMGEMGGRGTAPGDLYVRVRVKPHHLFERQGDNSSLRQELKVIDLLLGKKVEVRTVSGWYISRWRSPRGSMWRHYFWIPG